MQSVTLLGVGEELGAVVVQQNEVEFFRAVHLAGLAGAGDHRVVTGEGLARPGGGQHG